MTEYRDPWPADKEPKERGKLSLFGPFHSQEAVEAAFTKLYGYPPEYSRHYGGGWLVGPIREEG